jgi:2-polyprenyl-6-methoxyphenol hydroxylase-like FAD-dependent oxidoreductase
MSALILTGDGAHHGIEVTASNGEGKGALANFRCKLVVGADGYKSKVRECMSHKDKFIGDEIEQQVMQNPFSTMIPPRGQFLKTNSRPSSMHTSPTAGLRIKVLQSISASLSNSIP